MTLPKKVIAATPGGILAALLRDLEAGERLDNVVARERQIDLRGCTASDLTPADRSTAKGNIRKAFMSPSITLKTMSKLVWVLGFDEFHLGIDIFTDDATESHTVTIPASVEVGTGRTPDLYLTDLLNSILIKRNRRPKRAAMSIKAFTRHLESIGLRGYEVSIGIKADRHLSKQKTYAIGVVMGVKDGE